MAIQIDKKQGVIRRVRGMDSDVYEFFKNRNFRFTSEVLTSYILALQTKPFVILTGISGTGKTKIAQIFADYLTQGNNEEETRNIRKRRIAFVPVRPDWMDNRGLLGFYNPITKKYQATEVLRLLLEAQDNPGEPHFVILDEMNLAKVEYYFSDFLSILESRTSDQSKGESLILHDQGTGVETEDEVEILARLKIPSNVFFTGTVNIDETTYMFSPKVLDRANVIEFNEVDFEGFSEKQSSGNSFRLKSPDVRGLFQNEEHQPFCTITDFDKYSSLLKQSENSDPLAELFQILESHHLHFGYRVINEVSRFVVLAEKQVNKLNLNDALDIQFLQKILPKLHGTKGKLQKPLNQVFAFCYGKVDESEPEQQRLDKAMKYDPKALYPRTAQKVARMLNDLEQQGYTSFIQ
jgi:5-methylcytosine-specific restriction endonuclease McrBC GTP-binding regulatory subunit McrB